MIRLTGLSTWTIKVLFGETVVSSTGARIRMFCPMTEVKRETRMAVSFIVVKMVKGRDGHRTTTDYPSINTSWQWSDNVYSLPPDMCMTVP